MRRKKQIQAMQQELALLRQTIDSGKELAALATNTAQQLKKPSIKTVAVQLMRSPRFRRTALIVGGAASVGTIGAVAVRYRFYQTIVAQEVEKALKPVHAQLDDLQATVDAMAEAEGIEPEKTRKGNSSEQHGRSTYCAASLAPTRSVGCRWGQILRYKRKREKLSPPFTFCLSQSL